MVVAMLMAGMLAVSAQETPPPPDREGQAAVLLDELVVTGMRRETVRDVVSAISHADLRDGQLARFDHSVCVKVAGLSEANAQTIAVKVMDAAEQVGLRARDRDCQPNIIVLATTDVERDLPLLMEAMPRSFAAHAKRRPNGLRTLDAFENAEGPVRWWHVINRRPTGPLLAYDNQNMAVEASDSRLRSSMRSDILGAVVVVDFAQIDSVNLWALGDYIAMVSLARIDPGADHGVAPSILNLFDDTRSAPHSLTAFDRSYLVGLYAAPRDAVHGGQQRSRILTEVMSAGRSGEP